MEKYILHVDVNNAYLSWSAVNMLNSGKKIDIREINCAIAGDEKRRVGIILAKSNGAKKVGIKTGMTIAEAKKLCPNLQLFLPEHKIYKVFSDKLYNLLLEYTDIIERYSIDECFLDMTNYLLKRDIFEIANEIKFRIKNELGFTVNIGISDKKYLAKMASDFEKPDKIHTLFSNEINKIYNLPVENLFMLGTSTKEKMNNIRIMTIGDLAKSDIVYIKKKFGKHGIFLHNLANGIDDSNVEYIQQMRKNIGHDITLPENISDIDELNNILLNISGKISQTLVANKQKATTVAVKLRTPDFKDKVHQIKTNYPINSQMQIYEIAKHLLGIIYFGQDVRLIGIRCMNLVDDEEEYQYSFFENLNDMKYSKKITEKKQEVENVVSDINKKYGENTTFKASELLVHKYIKKDK